MSGAAPIPAENDTVAAAARDALERAGGDARGATTLLIEAAQADRDLYEALTAPFLANAAYAAIRRLCQQQRKQVWTAPRHHQGGSATGSLSPAALDDRERVIVLAQGNAETLLDFRLPIKGLPKLADATREMVAEATEYYRTRAADMGQKARWLTLVLQSVPEGRRVGEVLTDERLRDLQQEAAGDV